MESTKDTQEMCMGNRRQGVTGLGVNSNEEVPSGNGAGIC